MRLRALTFVWRSCAAAVECVSARVSSPNCLDKAPHSLSVRAARPPRSRHPRRGRWRLGSRRASRQSPDLRGRPCALPSQRRAVSRKDRARDRSGPGRTHRPSPCDPRILGAGLGQSAVRVKSALNDGPWEVACGQALEARALLQVMVELVGRSLASLRAATFGAAGALEEARRRAADLEDWAAGRGRA
jgi:hypothetical protein